MIRHLPICIHNPQSPCARSGQRARAVIPPHLRAAIKGAYDTWLYRERHLVECWINKLKHLRRIVSRFDKLDRSYLGFLHVI
jgi:transposase